MNSGGADWMPDGDPPGLPQDMSEEESLVVFRPPANSTTDARQNGGGGGGEREGFDRAPKRSHGRWARTDRREGRRMDRWMDGGGRLFPSNIPNLVLLLTPRVWRDSTTALSHSLRRSAYPLSTDEQTSGEKEKEEVPWGGGVGKRRRWTVRT